MDIFLRTLQLAAVLALGAGTANAATFTVNSRAQTADANAGNGICETAPGNGICTLEAAIQESNATPGIVDTIQFSVTGTIVRSGTPSCLFASANLVGPSNGGITLDGENQVRPLCISNGGTNGAQASISISNLALNNGLIVSTPGVSTDFGGGGCGQCRDGPSSGGYHTARQRRQSVGTGSGRQQQHRWQCQSARFARRQNRTASCWRR